MWLSGGVYASHTQGSGFTLRTGKTATTHKITGEERTKMKRGKPRLQ